MGNYVSDFETTTDGVTTRVWLWATSDIDGNIVARGTSIESYIAQISNTSGEVHWFHNLKYDGTYIVDYLLKNGFEHSEKRKLEAKQFSTMVDDMGNWYGLQICFKTGNKKKKQVKLHDSAKKLIGSVADIAKRFNMEVTKGDIDHSIYRPIGHVPTPEEVDYCDRDVIIIANALKVMFTQDMTKITSSSDALHLFRKTIGANRFGHLFPSLPKAADDLIRAGYKGGYVFVNPNFEYNEITKANYDVGSGRVYDVNSLYPFVMYTRLLPFGKPRFYAGKYKEHDGYPLYTQVLRADITLKPNHFPTIQAKSGGRFGADKYVKDSDGMMTLVLNSLDLALMFEQYDVHAIEYQYGYMFQATTGIFNEYLDHWREIKENSTGGVRETAKLMQNSLYGKFGTNPMRYNMNPYLEDGIVKWQLDNGTLGKSVYIPMASFITSYARDYVIRLAQANYDCVAYIDTDSMHIIGNQPIDIWEHPTTYGAWKLENHFESSRYLRPKTYFETDGEEDVVKCAGLPKGSRHLVDFENFLPSAVYGGKLVPKIIDGGAILIERDFTIKPKVL